VHFLCSDLVELTVFELVEMALMRCVIEEVHKQVKVLGFGEYKFQRSEAALIHVHPGMSGVRTPLHSQASTFAVWD